MYQRIFACLLIATWVAAVPLFGQQPCPSFSIAVGSDEDHLMLAINGADNPQEQIAALDKYAQANPNAKFMTCANEYYASIYLKQNNFDKSIEYAEKDLAANYQDLNLLLTLMRAYVGSTKVSDTIFDAINKVPEQVQTEVKPTRPDKATDADWEKIQKDAAELVKDSRAYAVYAFFQLEPRLTDPAKRIQILDAFLKVYPEEEKNNAAQINRAYFQAYQMQSNLAKIVEYGDKVVAADPNDVEVLNTLGLVYAFYMNPTSTEKAAGYAQKALAVAQDLKKPEGVDDAAFKREQTNQLGMSHLVLGYADFVRAQKTKKLAPAFEELKSAVSLLDGNPALQGQALYYLAYAYESGYPANHRGAIEALTKAESLPGPFQERARELLAKVRAATKQ
jgi:tetratricopeptide (TPR) repeat protein